MAFNGQTELSTLSEMLSGHDTVAVRAAVVKEGERWSLFHARVTLDTPSPVSRRWAYDTVVFLEAELPGTTIAGLLRGQAHEINGLKIEASDTQTTTASTQRLRGWQEHTRVTTPWPRTEWTIGRTNFSNSGDRNEILVGDAETPSFLNFDQAFSAFFYNSPRDNNGSGSDLWRIVAPHRDAWLARITVSADAMTVNVDGSNLTDVALELSDSTGHQTLPVTDPGAYTLPLPDGLAADSFLVLRRDREWLDQRAFPALTYGRVRDDSVEWEQPGTELEVILAGGESQYVELKAEVPHGESRKKMLKSVAAFTAQAGGGTVLIGVADDLEIVGLAEHVVLDEATRAVTSMIRDTIEPEPPYTLRVVEHEGKRVLVIEVAQATQPCAYRNSGGRLEFFVRRGASTPPARHYEIASGFQTGSAPGRFVR